MSLRHYIALIATTIVGSGCVADNMATAKETHQSLTLNDRIAACSVDARVVAGTVSTDVCVGADLFLRETFNGNGRSCATCHRVDHNLTIDPTLISQLPANDPLFIAETNPALAKLEVPAMMRQFGLILENVDGFAPDPTTHFVLRSVPHTLSLATSITRSASDPVTTPADRTGWSGDGAPGAGTLRDFQTGAIMQHYTKSLSRTAGTDFRLATSDELDRIDLFMRQVGRINELVIPNVVMTDAGAEAGRVKFLSVGCNGCHTNAGANAGFGDGGNRNFNTGVESARNAALAAFPKDGGFLTSPANADGSFGNGTFNVPPLIEAADTGPFFHTAVTISGASAHNTDVARTIEEAIAFYDSPAFNNSPAGKVGPIDLTATDIDNIGRFLRGLNASFNIALISKRLDASAAVMALFGTAAHLDIQNQLLNLAVVEAADAQRVLSEVPSLNGVVITSMRAVAVLVNDMLASTSVDFRTQNFSELRQLLAAANAELGSNLGFKVGAGTVMF